MPIEELSEWRPVLTGNIAGQVPDLLDSTNVLVTDAIATTQAYTAAAIETANAAIEALSDASMPPALPSPPARPSIITSLTLGGGLGASDPPNLGTLTTENVLGFSPDDIVIPDISSEMPVYVPVVTGLTIPEPPIFAMPASPTAPGLNTDFDIADAPAADYGLPPSLFELDLPEYAAPSMPTFTDTAPEFNEVPPSPFVQWTEPVYSSPVKTAVAAVLAAMLAGGTGLDTDTERAIWERARERENVGTLRAIAEATSYWSARGFEHPPGQLNGQILSVRDAALSKANELSREIMIAQATLEQTNRNFAVKEGISFEQVFVALYGQIVDRNFQIAKFTVETQVQIYNMQIAAFNVNQAVFAQKGERFRLLLEAAFADLKVFQALVDAEKVKADMNVALIQSYDSKVKAFGQQVEAYKALIMSVTARADLEKNKVELFKAQIEGQVAEISVQRGAFEAYAARVGGESAKANLEESNARVFGSKVQAFAVQSETGLKRAEVELQSNRLELDYSVANISRVTANQGQQLANIQANLAAYQASTARTVAEHNATLSVTQLANTTQIELARLSIARYSAELEQWKTRSQEIIQMAAINAESARAAGQIASNLASGAMASTHVSAGLSAGVQASQTRSDNKTESLGFSQSQADSIGYQTTVTRKGGDVA